MAYRDRRPRIMGILNLTPDSFSDGGLYSTVEKAVDRVREMLEQGADIIDIGGESTRPGAEPVAVAEQKARVLETIKALRIEFGADLVLSIDTSRSEVAEAALDAGVDIVNDITAGRGDERMFALCAERSASVVLMHMQGTPATMQIRPAYHNVVEQVRDFLLARAEAAQQAGIDQQRIIIDPGIGFGKTREHNLSLLKHLNRFVDTGYTVLLAASRKRFMGSLLKQEDPKALVSATCATTVLGVAAGVIIFRVHDVAENRQAADTAAAIMDS